MVVAGAKTLVAAPIVRVQAAAGIDVLVERRADGVAVPARDVQRDDPALALDHPEHGFAWLGIRPDGRASLSLRCALLGLAHLSADPGLVRLNLAAQRGVRVGV